MLFILLCHVEKGPLESSSLILTTQMYLTFAASDVGIRRSGGHLEGQAVGSLEGVTVSDEESSRFLVLQNSYGYGREDTLRYGC